MPAHGLSASGSDHPGRTSLVWWDPMPSAIEQANAPTQLDRFVATYNEERPHQARGCPPMQAQRAPSSYESTRVARRDICVHPCNNTNGSPLGAGNDSSHGDGIPKARALDQAAAWSRTL